MAVIYKGTSLAAPSSVHWHSLSFLNQDTGSHDHWENMQPLSAYSRGWHLSKLRDFLAHVSGHLTLWVNVTNLWKQNRNTKLALSLVILWQFWVCWVAWCEKWLWRPLPCGFQISPKPFAPYFPKGCTKNSKYWIENWAYMTTCPTPKNTPNNISHYVTPCTRWGRYSKASSFLQVALFLWTSAPITSVTNLTALFEICYVLRI